MNDGVRESMGVRRSSRLAAKAARKRKRVTFAVPLAVFIQPPTIGSTEGAAHMVTTMRRRRCAGWTTAGTRCRDPVNRPPDSTKTLDDLPDRVLRTILLHMIGTGSRRMVSHTCTRWRSLMADVRQN